MKKSLYSLLFLVLTLSLQAQLGVSYHQSVTSFFGVNYTFFDRIFTEGRMGTNIVADEVYGELIATYKLVRKDDHEIYAGIGATSGPEGFDGGGVLPIGINLYPFDNRKFGMHAEAAYLIVDDGIIRGSFGIRYQFLKD